MAHRENHYNSYRRHRRRRRLRPLAVFLWMLLAALCIGMGIFIAYGFTYIWNEKPELTLNGPAEMNLEMPEKYEEQGASATVGDSDLSDQLVISGEVDDQTPGDYTVTYTLKNYRRQDFQITRTVHVADTTPPELKLEDAEEDISVSAAELYEEPGYTAVDAVDGDLTDSVEINTEIINDSTRRITYKVSDSSGNTAEAERMITVKDSVPPEITLEGNNEMKVAQGDNYIDPGYSAFDDADGDITDSVTVSGEVDTTRPGAYTIIYSVSDAAGNQTEMTRTVVVDKDGEPLDPDGSYVYMTFDDGPGYRVTERILDTLKENNVRATFFIINYPDDRIPLLKRMVEEGHTIGIHTWSHEYAECYATKDSYYEGVQKMKEKIKSDLGYDAFCIRFPGGSSNTVSRHYTEGVMTYLTQKMHDEGYKYYDWNVDSTDAEGNNRPVETIVENVTSGFKKGRGNVVLCHDIDTKETTAAALQAIIDYGKENGYEFLPISRNTPEVHHSVNN